jgi:hypothetical protein
MVRKAGILKTNKAIPKPHEATRELTVLAPAWAKMIDEKNAIISTREGVSCSFFRNTYFYMRMIGKNTHFHRTAVQP